MALTAIVRDISSTLGDCELSFVDRAPIDLALARRQHNGYCRALQAFGCELLRLPPIDDLPDAVFVEDTAVVVDEVAVLTRPGAVSRRPEVASVAQALSSWRPLRSIEAPGTLDGGDVLRVGRRVFVGRSARSNVDGIAQLRELLAPFGYRVDDCATRDCLHLKSAVTEVADQQLLLNPDWIDRALFDDYDCIEIDAGEPHAANALRVGQQLLYPDAFPRTLQRLRRAGIDVTTVAVSELQKAEGAVTCCSLVFAGRASD